MLQHEQANALSNINLEKRLLQNAEISDQVKNLSVIMTNLVFVKLLSDVFVATCVDFQPDIFDIKKYLQAVHTDFSKAGCVVKLNLPESLTMIPINFYPSNTNRFRLVIIELIRNSFKYGNSAPEVNLDIVEGCLILSFTNQIGTSELVNFSTRNGSFLINAVMGDLYTTDIYFYGNIKRFRVTLGPLPTFSIITES